MIDFTRELFENPGKEYRGMPFWAWNCRMDRDHVDRILSELKEMGMGGAYLHCRTGMDLPYLGEQFMEMIEYAHKRAGELDMLTGLYDEDRWPSGFAGGLVTREERYRGRFLCFSPEKLPERETVKEVGENGSSNAAAVSNGRHKYLAGYGVRLENGYLKEYVRLTEGEVVPEGFDPWYAYLEILGNNPWYNNQAYVNTLDPAAIREFIRITYEAYAGRLQSDFGKGIPAVFTDEPQFTYKTRLAYAEDRKPQTLSYTDDFDETYRARYGESILDYLPELFWELPDGEFSVHRYRYHDHVTERFVNAYADQIGAWCREHGILLTGHMVHEPSLEGQTMALGEAMRSYRGFGVPGIDMLCDRRELTTAKQAQSAVHQFGCSDMMCEIYGVTDWDFDFRGHKLSGDWQAALGVTWRVHHLTWTVMEGEAKRDYPASIGYQSPWYRKYPYIENYFARINTALHQGKPVVKLGVIHPIESYWLCWGDSEHTEGICRGREENFQNLVNWLLYGLIDFDFISESLLADWEQTSDKGFTAGTMTYDVILVPDCITLRRTTAARLEEFAARGGTVIFAGTVPSHVDGVRNEDVRNLSESCKVIPFAREAVLKELQPVRLLDIRDQSGARSSNLLYQFRREGQTGWLFIAHSEKSKNPDLACVEHLRIEIDGCWKVERLNAMTGEIQPAESVCRDKKTYIHENSYEHDSFLYRLQERENGTAENDGSVSEKDSRTGFQAGKRILVPDRVRVCLTEPNVLLLDQAEYSFDGEPWQPREEVLRIDNRCRSLAGYPLRAEAYAQPWISPEESGACHSLELLFTVESDWGTDGVMLALEKPGEAEIYWDEIPVSSGDCGYYVDRSIRTVAMPALTPGTHKLRVKLPYYRKCNVEAMYLLGDFGVRVEGSRAVVKAPAREISFGSICGQGLAFYGGNLVYEMPVDVLEDGLLSIQISQFRASVLEVSLDGEERGLIAISPYILELGMVSAGRHVLRVTAYGNRFNTFGTLHNCNRSEAWAGPNAWRSEGTAWAYEYQLRETGILKTPELRLMTDAYGGNSND